MLVLFSPNICGVVLCILFVKHIKEITMLFLLFIVVVVYWVAYKDGNGYKIPANPRIPDPLGADLGLGAGTILHPTDNL